MNESSNDTDRSAWVKNSIAIHVSREDAIFYGHVKPTAGEVAEYNAKARASWEAAIVEWEALDAFRGEVDALTGDTTRAVLDLHRPASLDIAECQGCPSDADDTPAPWPCVTVEVVARVAGIEPPTAYFGRRPDPQPHTMRPEGYEPIADPLTWAGAHEAFVRAFDIAALHGEA